jgi:acyl-coenzyme A thioesterase PaaI-like protein
VEDAASHPLPSHYDRCFGCGQDHPTGLHLQMEAATETSVRGSFTVTEHHQGAPGLAHGGVISAAVDEGMGYLLWLVESPAVTAHIEVNFRRPVPVGAQLELEARLEGVKGRKIRASLTGWVDGEIAVDAKALYLKVGVEHFVPHAERMGQRMADRPYNP